MSAIGPDRWRNLASLTPARIALGRAGAGLPTREVLAFARERLDGGDHLYRDRLTFADMTLAAAMQFVAPLPPPAVRLGARYRACWADPEVADGFEDLVAWRDALVARHPFVPR